MHLVGQSQLTHVVHALRTTSSLPRRLNRRQQQGHQDSNDCDNDKKFDERKASASPHDEISLHAPVPSSLVSLLRLHGFSRSPVAIGFLNQPSAFTSLSKSHS